MDNPTKQAISAALFDALRFPGSEAEAEAVSAINDFTRMFLLRDLLPYTRQPRRSRLYILLPPIPVEAQPWENGQLFYELAEEWLELRHLEEQCRQRKLRRSGYQRLSLLRRYARQVRYELVTEERWRLANQIMGGLCSQIEQLGQRQEVADG